MAESVVRTDSASMAMLVVLETLSPAERAMFVLREVFHLPMADIAEVLDRSKHAVRQLAHRAREYVHARPRYDADRERRHEVTEAFLAACRECDLDTLVGAAESAGAADLRRWRARERRVAAGRGCQLRDPVPVRASPRKYEGTDVALVDLNGEPGLVMTAAGEPIATVQLTTSDGRIDQIWSMRQPDKLSALDISREMTTR